MSVGRWVVTAIQCLDCEGDFLIEASATKRLLPGQIQPGEAKAVPLVLMVPPLCPLCRNIRLASPSPPSTPTPPSTRSPTRG